MHRSAWRNPGPGGSACISALRRREEELFGYDPHTTNNRMELTAAIRGLFAFKERCEVDITTDALYCPGRDQAVVVRWKRRRNTDLRMELDELNQLHHSVPRKLRANLFDEANGDRNDAG